MGKRIDRALPGKEDKIAYVVDRRAVIPLMEPA
jgi:hypothetical protein